MAHGSHVRAVGHPSECSRNLATALEELRRREDIEWCVQGDSLSLIQQADYSKQSTVCSVRTMLSPFSNSAMYGVAHDTTTGAYRTFCISDELKVNDGGMYVCDAVVPNECSAT